MAISTLQYNLQKNPWKLDTCAHDSYDYLKTNENKKQKKLYYCHNKILHNLAFHLHCGSGSDFGWVTTASEIDIMPTCERKISACCITLMLKNGIWSWSWNSGAMHSWRSLLVNCSKCLTSRENECWWTIFFKAWLEEFFGVTSGDSATWCLYTGLVGCWKVGWPSCSFRTW